MSPYLAVLSIKSFRNLWLAQVASQVAVNMMAFVLTIQVYEQTKSNTAVSLLILAIGIPALLLGSVAGVLVDQWEKRNVLIICNILRAFLVASLFFFRESLPVVFISAILISLITQFFIPAEGPLIPEYVPDPQLLTANGLFTFSYYASVAVGFILSGPLLRVMDAHGIFLFISSGLFLAGFFSARIPREKGREKEGQPIAFSLAKVMSELQYGFAYLKRKRTVWEALLMFTAAQAFVTTIAALAPGFADRVLLIDLTDASVVVMGPAIAGLIIGSLLLGSLAQKVKQDRLVTAGVFGVGAVLFILSLFIRIGGRPELVNSVERILPASFQVERLDVAMFLFFLLGIFNSLIVVPLSAVLQRDTEEEVRGRIYGMLSALTGGVSVLPVVGAGWLADLVGVGKTIFALSLAVLSFGLYRVWLMRKIHSTRQLTGSGL